MIDRRKFLATSGAIGGLAAMPGALRAAAPGGAFPKDFLWGAATAGHQIEGNNIASDIWLLEHVKPSIFKEVSGDAANSFELWPIDLDLVKALGLNSYRFSIEWARIEPEPGQFSQAMLDHYGRMIDGCHERGIAPQVTFNHFASPAWFSASGGWTNADAPEIFARYCSRAAGQLADRIDHAFTFNEPNLLLLLRDTADLPPQVREIERATLAAAARQTNSEKFVAANLALLEDLPRMQELMLAGHAAGKAALKAERSSLPVGFSLAISDDQAVGDPGLRDTIRERLYGDWLRAARSDDFLGVQNYERNRWGAKGRLPAPADAVRNFSGAEVYAPSLAGAVRYAHEASGVPIIVSEHGVGTSDDTIRANLIPAALRDLRQAIADGVPVKGYHHWSLLDNFEWIFGYGPKFGLFAVDAVTFKRTAKPSAAIYAKIARANAV